MLTTEFPHFFLEAAEVSCLYSVSSFPDPRTKAQIVFGSLKSSRRAPQSLVPGTPGLLKQVQPFHKAGILRCGHSAVFPMLTTPDDVDLEGVAGDRKAHPVPGTCLGLIALPENGSCAFVLLDDVPLDDVPPADRSVVHVHTSASRGPRHRWRCSCCTCWAAPPC